MVRKWDVAEVDKRLAEADKQLAIADDFINGAHHDVMQACHIKHLPQEWFSKLSSIASDLERIERIRKRIQDRRKELDQSDINRWKGKTNQTTMAG